jgi:hypothetical protein
MSKEHRQSFQERRRAMVQIKLTPETDQEIDTTLEEDLIATVTVVNNNIMTHKDIDTFQENEQEIDTNLEGGLGAPVDIEKEYVTKHQVMNNVEHANWNRFPTKNWMY